VGSSKSRNERHQAQGFVRRGCYSLRRSVGRILPDSRHSSGEDRLVLLGNSDNRRLVAVMYVERGKTIRIISARRYTSRTNEL